MADPSSSSSAAPATTDTSTPNLLPGGFHAFAPQSDFLDNSSTNSIRPLTDAIITVRIIKSFEFRSMKAYVVKGIDLTTTSVADLEQRCVNEVRTNPAFKAFRSYAPKLDTLKLYTRAHGSKTTNLIINLDHPEWLLTDDNVAAMVPGKSRATATLAELGIENEHELSLFNRDEYERFLANPEVRWDSTG
ncbi:uncharacterized protein PFL1_00709 [Pseudozyma flocculosa PF-1]|uniref:Related to UPF0538 protein C2C4.04c n=1 Tax=Pseudozyma flocculosa TaxID=84751 RepID=A0A5C3F4G7_9BASI|nr:uncharacterized protein PFL1_00709 [Pseudozyma flocculosa PF-1]EPQ31374.1 hypothetical protein PFL1_00709 [Pseudozyma flocculosa PF-1]SPO38846.1 related to UPF0538 protein C2C4.04c [Pseudozyma flocculosa]